MKSKEEAEENKAKKQKRRKNAITSEDDSEEEKKQNKESFKKDNSSDKDYGSGVIELFDKEYSCIAKNDEKIKIGQNPPQIHPRFINDQIT